MLYVLSHFEFLFAIFIWQINLRLPPELLHVDTLTGRSRMGWGLCTHMLAAQPQLILMCTYGFFFLNLTNSTHFCIPTQHYQKQNRGFALIFSQICNFNRRLADTRNTFCILHIYFADFTSFGIDTFKLSVFTTNALDRFNVFKFKVNLLLVCLTLCFLLLLNPATLSSSHSLASAGDVA